MLCLQMIASDFYESDCSCANYTSMVQIYENFT